VVDAAPLPPAPPSGIRSELPTSAEPADLQAVQDSYEAKLADLLTRWPSLAGAQVTAILDQIEGHVGAGDVAGLLSVAVSSTEAAAVLEQAMLDLGNEAGAQVVAEAVKQGLSENDLHATPPERLRTAQSAQVYAGQLAAFLAGSAIGETMRVWLRGRTPRDVRGDVAAHLGSLTTAYPELVLGGALTQAQHDGRWRTMLGGPEAALYADEVLDKNTCGPCRDVNRKWIGNASDTSPSLVYPVAGYVGCLGRWRCRGQVVAVWRGGDNWREWVELPAQRTSPD
jgi:hypothetical protein